MKRNFMWKKLQSFFRTFKIVLHDYAWLNKVSDNKCLIIMVARSFLLPWANSYMQQLFGYVSDIRLPPQRASNAGHQWLEGALKYLVWNELLVRYHPCGKGISRNIVLKYGKKILTPWLRSRESSCNRILPFIRFNTSTSMIFTGIIYVIK